VQKALLALAVVALASPARAAYPEQPVTLVVPFPAGGPTDKLARDLSELLSRRLKNQPWVIENVGGAGGTLGAAKVAKASPDGYTLLVHHIGMATSRGLYRQLPFQALDDFEYLGMVNEVPMVVVGRPGLPAKNYTELVTWLKANRGKINLAHAGLGTASHLCGLLLQQHLKIHMNTVPYKGTAPALNDLLGGQVDVLCDQTSNTADQIATGTLKAFAVTTLKPLTAPELAQLPTLDSQGLKGFNVSIWHGLYAPKGTPQAVLDQLNAALRATLLDSQFIRRQEALGAVVVTDARLSPNGHRRFVEAEIAKWGPTIQAAGQRAD
jgi:tripartite-type tricarboxylate transporter receptor subunit TctC